jgi:hypothetical protein
MRKERMRWIKDTLKEVHHENQHLISVCEKNAFNQDTSVPVGDSVYRPFHDPVCSFSEGRPLRPHRIRRR